VAVGVLAILGGLILPLVLRNLEEARLTRARKELTVIAGAILSQLEDTGCRPVAEGGPGHCDGSGQAIWHSGGRPPRLGPGPGGVGWRGVQAHNSFANLFCADFRARPLGNALFGLGPADPRDRFVFKGPYMTEHVASQADPWGNAYLVLGYNKAGQDADGPIWVVCCGAKGSMNPANLGGFAGFGEGGLPWAWDHSGLSSGNLVLRVH